MTDREIDALIAEKLLNLSFAKNREYVCIDSDWVDLPRYSTDPAACAQVLDALEARGCSYVLYYEPLLSEPYRFQFSAKDGAHHASAESRERAVCLGTLRALGEEV
jgi:hypothetical protein